MPHFNAVGTSLSFPSIHCGVNIGIESWQSCRGNVPLSQTLPLSELLKGVLYIRLFSRKQDLKEPQQVLSIIVPSGPVEFQSKQSSQHFSEGWRGNLLVMLSMHGEREKGET